MTISRATLAILASVFLSGESRLVGQAVWSVDPTPTFDVSEVGRRPLSLVVGGMRTRDGRVLIADGAESVVHVLDAAGGSIRSHGRRGSGPGEFDAIFWAGRCGADSLLVWDVGRQQSSMVTVGGVARQFRLQPDTTSIPGARSGAPRQAIRLSPVSLGCSRTGQMAYSSMGVNETAVAGYPAPAQVWRSQGYLVRITPEGIPFDRVGPVHVGEFVRSRNVVGGGFSRVPLGPQMSFVVVDDRLIVASADAPEVVSVDVSGRRVPIPVPSSNLRLTPRDRDAVNALELDAMNPRLRPAFEELLEALPLPSVLPPYYAIHTDPAGFLWLQMTPAGFSVTELAVLDAAGRRIATVRIPRALKPLDIGIDYILGTYVAESGEPRVTLLKLNRR